MNRGNADPLARPATVEHGLPAALLRSATLAALATLAGCTAGWMRVETDHLTVYAKPDTFAGRNLGSAAKEYESVAAWMWGILPATPRRMRVFLHDGEPGRLGWVNRVTGSANYLYTVEVRLAEGRPPASLRTLYS